MDLEKELTFAMMRLQRGDLSGFNIIEKFAKTGDPLALTFYAICFDMGSGTKQDYKKALELFNKAYESGSDDALGYIARYYYVGNGVPEDEIKAMELFDLAIKEKHNAAAMAILGEIYLNDDRADEAIPLLEEAIKGENAHAIELLACCYTSAKCYNRRKADKYFKQAGELGLPLSAFNLSIMYKDGEDVPQDDDLAFKYTKIAAEQNFCPAIQNLGGYYILGYGCEKNVQKGLDWLIKGSTMEAHFLYRVGLVYFLYSEELGVPQSTCIDWFEKASHYDPKAFEMLARIYEKGIGVPVDKKKAESYKAKIRMLKCFQKHLKD